MQQMKTCSTRVSCCPRLPKGVHGVAGLVSWLGTSAVPIPNGFPPGANNVQTESSLKAVPRWRHWILPQQCRRQHLMRLAKPRYWVGNREHASDPAGVLDLER